MLATCYNSRSIGARHVTGFRAWLGREVAMQNFVRWISVIFAVLTAIPAVAGSIGFMDTERAIKTVKEGQRQYQILDAWANQRADEVEATQNRVNELTQRLNAQRTVASADAITKLENDLLQAQRELEDVSRALQADFQRKQRELLDEVASRLRTVAADYAAANSIDAIFILETQPLVYLAESAVITDEVIRLYDERFPIE
jgi:Skp family chaperone for outer membrane proteins